MFYGKIIKYSLKYILNNILENLFNILQNKFNFILIKKLYTKAYKSNGKLIKYKRLLIINLIKIFIYLNN